MAGGISVKTSQNGEMTAKQWQFCNEYMKDRNVAAAARRAGYKTPSIGPKLLKNREVRKEIARREREVYEESCISVAEIVGRLAEVMRFDIADLCDENGHIVLDDLHELPAEARACIKEIDYKNHTDDDGRTYTQAKIKMYSKLEAADMLMRYFGAYKPEVLQQLVQLDWAALEKRSDITEDDPLTRAIASLEAPEGSE